MNATQVNFETKFELFLCVLFILTKINNNNDPCTELEIIQILNFISEGNKHDNVNPANSINYI